MSSLHEVAEGGDVARVQQLLDEGADKEAEDVRAPHRFIARYTGTVWP